MGLYKPWRTSDYSKDTELFTGSEIIDIMINMKYPSEELYEIIKDRSFRYQLIDPRISITPEIEKWCKENPSRNKRC